MAGSQESPKRIAVAAAMARLATSPNDHTASTSGPVKYRVKVTKEPHVDAGAAVNGGEGNEQFDPGVGPVQDCKGKGKARADCTNSQKITSFYRLKLDGCV